MAKKKEVVAPVAAPKAAPNLFAKAAVAAKAAPKKEKGTMVQLPQQLDTDGKLVGESAILNNAVTAAIEAKAEENAAKTKGALAKGKLMTFAQSRVVELYAKLGVAPPTPVSVVNHNGESVTYVMADKSQQNPINEQQVSLFQSLLGDEGAARVVHEKTQFFFDPATMDETAANDQSKTVFEIVCELVSTALAADARLSDEQKGAIIKSTTKTFLQVNVLDRVAELCGADSARIAQFYDAAGTACVRSIKV
jgi:hypothetical protein